jgi:hypothetical protein
MKTLAGYFKLEDNVWQHYYVDYPRMWELTPLYMVAACPEAFCGFPDGPVSSSNADGKCVTAGETAPSHTVNTAHKVAVSTDTYWQPIETCPRAVKVQLLGKGGVATYGLYNGDKFWENWCPLPKKAKA